MEGVLVKDQTVVRRSFEVMWVDHIGPVYYHTKTLEDFKTYMLF